MSQYKHSEVPSGSEIYYLKCLKRPHWVGEPDNKIHKDYGLKRGSLTWAHREDVMPKEKRVYIEENRFGVNFDISCFKFVDATGAPIDTPDIPEFSRYRFKTKEELIEENLWNFKLKCPISWTPDMNSLVGTVISAEHNDSLYCGNYEGLADGRLSNNQQITYNEKPITLVDAEYYEEKFDALPKYRFKSKRELRRGELWHEGLDIPIGWGNNPEINRFLQAGIPSDFDSICDEGGIIEIGEVEVSSDFYTLVSEDSITFEYLKEMIIRPIESIEVPVSEDPTEMESMQKMEAVLDKVYDNEELRESIVPLFIGNPGLGKTKIIEKFAEKKGVKLVELITSQMSPFEISGIAMPDKDLKKMTYYNYDKIESLEDGDILFFDELLNGNPVVLNACLTILEQRRLISGQNLPKILIIAAANPQGMVPLTPQIKERFLWYNVEFSPKMWQAYMAKKYQMPIAISGRLCNLIQDEKFTNNNFHTPRSIDKAVSMIAKDCPTPYKDVIEPILSHMMYNNTTKPMSISKTESINPGESMLWLDFLKKSRE